MEGYCGANCDNCGYGKNLHCKGCKVSNGCPFGKECFIAKYIKVGDKENFNVMKKNLINEFNSLKIPGMPTIKDLFPLNGSFVNLKYTMPNGKIIDLLDNNEIYLGNQVECEFNDGQIIRCFGLVCNMSFIMVSEYGPNGSNPELIIYKKL